MDLLESCRAFISVADRGSFTQGAAAARTSQSAASRRIAALEAELGGPLFDRSARRAALTVFGRRMLPTARTLVDAAESLTYQALTERSSPVRLAVPEGCDVRDLAGLELSGRDRGIPLVLVPAAPAVRAQVVATDQVDLALIACPADQAVWDLPLGLAGALESTVAADIAQLRPGRLDDRDQHRTVWLLPEDDVPHLRDPLVRYAEASGLLTSQMRMATSPAAALAAVLASTDLLLCSRAEAASMELSWQQLASPGLRRGHALVAAPNGAVDDLSVMDDQAIADCLGVDP